MLKKIKNRKAYLIKTALYGCLRHLSNGKEPEKLLAVCSAIYRWEFDDPSEFRKEAANEAVNYIGRILRPHMYMTTWLANATGNQRITTSQMQTYRRAWVMHMIKQMSVYEKEEP